MYLVGCVPSGGKLAPSHPAGSVTGSVSRGLLSRHRVRHRALPGQCRAQPLPLLLPALRVALLPALRTGDTALRSQRCPQLRLCLAVARAGAQPLPECGSGLGRLPLPAQYQRKAQVALTPVRPG